MTRTFIALEFDEALRRYLDELMHRMARDLPSLRWVDPAGIHLTLAFLGELTDEQLAKALQASEGAAQQVAPFTLRLSHPGIFGSPRQPRVIWMGIEEPSGRLIQLHRVLNRELEQHSFEVENRSFAPHLTLSRIKAPLSSQEQQRLQRLLADTQIAASAPTQQVNSISVMKSELSRAGAKYTCLQSYPLGKDK